MNNKTTGENKKANNQKPNKPDSQKTAKKECNLKPSHRIKTHRIEKGVKRCLIVENMQNCFFSGGSMGFKKRSDENAFIKRVNQLISLHEIDDRYKKASKSGREKKTMLGGVDEGIETNSRKKNYFDLIIFTQDGNPPDHWTFASHHYLRDPDTYDYFSGSNKGKKKTYKCKGKRCKRKTKILLPEHALTDGSDRYKAGGENRVGIDFHPKLDVRSLYRPNKGVHPSAFIRAPVYHNRGFIVFKGYVRADGRSAFKNSLDQKTGLGEFLKCNGINSLFVCGMDRENSVTNSIVDSLEFSNLGERVIVYDATMPVGIDYMGDNSVFKNTINNNNYVNEMRKKKIKVVTLKSMIDSIKKGESIHDRDEPTGTLSKSLRSMENLFASPTKK